MFTGENEYLQIMNSTKQADSKWTLRYLYLSVTLFEEVPKQQQFAPW